MHNSFTLHMSLKGGDGSGRYPKGSGKNQTHLEKWNADPRVSEAFHDSDGYWVYLKDGFRSEPGLHMIHEDTAKEVQARIRDVEICTDDCCGSACRKSLGDAIKSRVAEEMDYLKGGEGSGRYPKGSGGIKPMAAVSAKDSSGRKVVVGDTVEFQNPVDGKWTSRTAKVLGIERKGYAGVFLQTDPSPGISTHDRHEAKYTRKVKLN